MLTSRAAQAGQNGRGGKYTLPQALQRCRRSSPARVPSQKCCVSGVGCGRARLPSDILPTSPQSIPRRDFAACGELGQAEDGAGGSRDTCRADWYRRLHAGSRRLAEERIERRLAAILCADVVEYSRLMGTDEGKTRIFDDV